MSDVLRRLKVAPCGSAGLSLGESHAVAASSDKKGDSYEDQPPQNARRP